MTNLKKIILTPNKTVDLIWISRMGIFLLQLIVITVLLWASDEATAYSTIPIPSWYHKNPPDVGKWHYQSGEDGGGRVWIPGLTDDMDQTSKDAYYDIKKSSFRDGWSVVRKDVAAILQLVQNHPNASCHDNMQAAAVGQVQMTCTYKDSDEAKKVSFTNITTLTFNKYFDDQFVTITEYHNNKTNKSNNSTNKKNPYAQYYDSHGNLIYKSNTNSPDSYGKNIGYAQGSSGKSSSYARYINNHVAPNYSNINRSTAAVFSMGNEQGLTLEEILKKKTAEYSPGVKERNKPK